MASERKLNEVIEMDICGEHGEDIAHEGRDCPACEQIDGLRDDFQDNINQMQEEIDELKEAKDGE